MANENKNVIISYFDSVEKATAAAESLKTWDKANDTIKLGGIGILKMEDGEIKTHNVGAVATGTGAKAGLIVGLVTGVLSGGITLVGGALAGLAGGALLGSLKHKSLGLTDGDLDTLKKELSSGKGALVVTADDDEVQPTMAEIEHLGGQVSSFTLDHEAQEALNQTGFDAERQQFKDDAMSGGMIY